MHAQSIIAAWKRRYRPATLKSNADGLIALLRFIGRSAGIEGLHRMVPRVRQAEPRQTILTPGDLGRLLAAAKPEMRIVLTLATSLGMRLNETLTACPAGYNAEKKTLTYTAKGPKVRTMPTTPDVDTLLQSCPPTDNPLTPFVDLVRTRPMTRRAAHWQWSQLKHRAGINPDTIIHDLRRTSADMLYELTKDLRLVEQLLGHNWISSSARYLKHKDPEKLRGLLAEMWRPKGGKETVQ